MAAQSSSLFFKSWAWLAGLPVTFVVAQQILSYSYDSFTRSQGLRSLIATIGLFTGLICLLSLAAAVVHTSAMKRITDRRTPIWGSALATFLASLTLVYAFRALLFIRALFDGISSFSMSDAMAEIVGVVFLLLFLVYIPMPWWITPRIEHLVRARRSLRNLRTSGTPSRQCSECGSFADVAKIGLPHWPRHHLLFAGIIVLLTLSAVIWLAALKYNNPSYGQQGWPVSSAAAQATVPLKLSDLTDTPWHQAIEKSVVRGRPDYAMPKDDAGFIGYLYLSFSDYAGGSKGLIRNFGWPSPWWSTETRSWYDDALAQVGPRPLTRDQLIQFGTDGNWHMNQGSDKRLVLTRRQILLNTTVQDQTIELAGIAAALGCALFPLIPFYFTLTLWQRMGPPRWRRYFRTAEECCADCGYPLSPATPAMGAMCFTPPTRSVREPTHEAL